MAVAGLNPPLRTQSVRNWGESPRQAKLVARLRKRERIATTVDDQLVDEAVQEVRRTIVLSASEAAHQLGAWLLAHFWGDSAAQFRSKKQKNLSFDALLARPELSAMGVSRTRLYDCVSICLQHRESGVEALLKLPKSHQIALLPAPRPAVADLAHDALEGAWSVRVLRAQVRLARLSASRGSRPGPGRPMLPEGVKAARAACSLLRGLAALDEELTPSEATSIAETLTEIESHVARLKALVREVSVTENAG